MNLRRIPANRFGAVALLCIVHFVISLGSYALFRQQIALLEPPNAWWSELLYYFTLRAPMAVASPLPPEYNALLGWMILQSLIVGILISIVIGGMLKLRWRRGVTGSIIRVVTVVLTLASTLLVQVIVIWVFTMWGYLRGQVLYAESARLTKIDERVYWLEKFIDVPGEVKAIEYRLLSFSEFMASGYRYRIAVKVSQKDIDQWVNLSGYQLQPYQPNAPENNGEPSCILARLIEELPVLEDPAWRRTSTPEYYAGHNNKYAVVYREEGIVLLYLSSSR